jgi:hypothetical protein
VVAKGLFGRSAQFARDVFANILRIETAVELDSHKDPHLDHGYAMETGYPKEEIQNELKVVDLDLLIY